MEALCKRTLTLSTVLVMIGYESIAIVHQKLLVANSGIALFISNNFFFLSSMILGMAVSHSQEVYLRRVFAQRIRPGNSWTPIHAVSAISPFHTEKAVVCTGFTFCSVSLLEGA